MVQTAVTEVIESLADFDQRFVAMQAEAANFFSEWQTDLLELTESERMNLDLIRQRFQYPGIPQILTYMMGAPTGQARVFGMVTNGTHFVFLKLERGEPSIYDFSDVFSMLARQNCLYTVFALLKQIAGLII